MPHQKYPGLGSRGKERKCERGERGGGGGGPKKRQWK